MDDDIDLTGLSDDPELLKEMLVMVSLAGTCWTRRSMRSMGSRIIVVAPVS